MHNSFYSMNICLIDFRMLIFQATVLQKEDNIFINDKHEHKSGLIYSSISDHFPIFISLSNVNFNFHDNTKKVSFRLIDNVRIRKFKSVIKNWASLQVNIRKGKVNSIERVHQIMIHPNSSGQVGNFCPVAVLDE